MRDGPEENTGLHCVSLKHIYGQAFELSCIRAAKTGRCAPSPSLPSFIPPSLISLFWPGLWSVSFFFSSFDLNSSSFSLNSCLSLANGRTPPSVEFSLSFAGSVCRSLVSVCLSVYPSVHVSRLSVHQAGGGPTVVQEGSEPLTSCVVDGLETVPVSGFPSL